MSAGPPGLQEGVLLAYYGDDFTGSTDAMEAMTAAGVPTVLFLAPPDDKWLARFAHARCIGVAGSSRGRSPEWMDRELPSAFQALARLGAPILQYKICSTFDSSPTTGSIGRAIDLGAPLMAGNWSPMIVGAPRLSRYQAFGNLFAAVGGGWHRAGPDRGARLSRRDHPADDRLRPSARARLRPRRHRLRRRHQAVFGGGDPRRSGARAGLAQERGVRDHPLGHRNEQPRIVRSGLMDRDGAELVVGPRFARTRWQPPDHEGLVQ